MAGPSRSTCAPWATIADVCTPCDDYAFDTALLDDCLQMASDVLYALSGSRYPGECTDTIRPAGACSCGAVGECGRHGWPYRYRLPRTPVVEVTKVTIDGVDLDTARYRVDNHRDLVYQPESTSALRQSWPLTQRLELATTETDTWAIEYAHGIAPPIGGLRSAAELGCQLALACQPETVGQCQLPRQVVNVARQGVTIALADPNALAALFGGGNTGLPVVDLWLGAERARARNRPATVRIPGRRRGAYRRTD